MGPVTSLLGAESEGRRDGVGAGAGGLVPGGNGQSWTWWFPSQLFAWEETSRFQAVFRCMTRGQ